MKKQLLLSLIPVFAGLVFSGAVLGAEDQKEKRKDEQKQEERQATKQGMPQDVMAASKLIGKEVKDRRGEKIGEVKDLLVDDSGRVRFVLLGAGGALGVGQKEHFVPFASFTSDMQQNTLTLKADQGKLANAPVRGEGVTGEQYDRQIYEHYGLSPYWEKSEKGERKQTPESDEKMQKNRETKPY